MFESRKRHHYPLRLEKQEREGLVEATIKKRRWFIKLVFPVLRKRPVSEIQPMEVLLALRPVEKKGRHESAKRALKFHRAGLSLCSGISIGAR